MGVSSYSKGLLLMDLVTNKMFITRDVMFRENEFPFPEAKTSESFEDFLKIDSSIVNHGIVDLYAAFPELSESQSYVPEVLESSKEDLHQSHAPTNTLIDVTSSSPDVGASTSLSPTTDAPRRLSRIPKQPAWLMDYTLLGFGGLSKRLNCSWNLKFRTEMSFKASPQRGEWVIAITTRRGGIAVTYWTWSIFDLGFTSMRCNYGDLLEFDNCEIFLHRDAMAA
ncbi:hypothetical protein T459_11619 [Capsicum annuum]|uniref:Retroviral polymerase SH3-like domain-containing protein n=1 Tax=Capsicum annuum TaxID=4072 RepID=A0A2G2ZMF6_CAPAN|nr:hypothetical protein T459_11619 [Capsicum annuum]